MSAMTLKDDEACSLLAIEGFHAFRILWSEASVNLVSVAWTWRLLLEDHVT